MDAAIGKRFYYQFRADSVNITGRKPDNRFVFCMNDVAQFFSVCMELQDNKL